MKYLILTLFIFSLFSCTKIKSNSREVLDQSVQVADSAMSVLAEELGPAYDSKQADTKNNKKRFEEYLEVKLSPDVKAERFAVKSLSRNVVKSWV
jgi:hypothetical protein